MEDEDECTCNGEEGGLAGGAGPCLARPPKGFLTVGGGRDWPNTCKGGGWRRASREEFRRGPLLGFQS